MLAVFAGIVLVSAAFGAEPGAEPAEKGPRVGLYDTGASSAEPLTGDAAAKREGWTLVADGKTPGSFKGDAVLANKLVTVVLRKGAAGAEIYAGTTGPRAVLAPAAGGAKSKISSVKATANGRGGVAVEAAFEGGTTVAFELKPAVPFVKATPAGEAVAMRVEAPSRFGVLPDFFADDMVVDAKVIPVDKTDIPGENFFMSMLDGGSAIVTAIWDKTREDITLTLATTGGADAAAPKKLAYGGDGGVWIRDDSRRVIESVQIPHAKDGSVWVSVLEGKGIWHHVDVPAGQRAAINLEWKIPFTAKWKGSFMRQDCTTDSWDFEYHPGKRGRWSGVVGGYNIPCWIDGKDTLAAYIEPPHKFTPRGSTGMNIQGPFIVYPIERTEKTPVESFTIVDLMRNSLGTGPCEYIMDVAGQGSSDKGLYTCSLEAVLPQFFEAGKQKDERVFLESMLEQVHVFVKTIQDRANAYVDFHNELLKWLGEQKTAHAELAEFITKMEGLTKKIGSRKAGGAPRVAKAVEPLKKAVTADDMHVNYHGTVRSVAGIGLSQDNQVARARLAVKVLRRQATIAMAIDPKTAPVAKEIRARTRKVLRGAVGHEMR
jgi:hypothetical protein